MRLFVSILTLLPEKTEHALDQARRLKVPRDIMIRAKLALFGRYDIIVVFDAKDEQAGFDFVTKLREIHGVVDTETLVAFDIRKT